MKLLYTHENPLLVENVRNCLSQQGVESVLRNEFAAGGAGGLAPLQTWPELWVNAEEYPQAQEMLEALLNAPSGQSWLCAHCGEENEGTFELCWNCQHARD